MLKFTTNQGLEDIVTKEFTAALIKKGITPGRFIEKPFHASGQVMYEHPEGENNILSLTETLFSVYNVSHFVWHKEFETADFLENLHNLAKSMDIPYLEQAESFRVCCRRVGSHPFQSPDVERLVGGALFHKYNKPVKMKGFHTKIVVDIYQNHCFVGIQLPKGLQKEGIRKSYSQKVSLKSAVAYGLLSLSGIIESPGTLADPFCGSGTLLLHGAALLLDIKLFGSDINEAAVSGAAENMAQNGFSHRARIKQHDAQEMSQIYPPGSIDYIITNPPFGVRMGKKINYYWLFKHFFQEADKVLAPGGKIVVLTTIKTRIITSALEDTALFVLDSKRVIEAGGINPGIYLFTRVEGKTAVVEK